MEEQEPTTFSSETTKTPANIYETMVVRHWKSGSAVQ